MDKKEGAGDVPGRFTTRSLRTGKPPVRLQENLKVALKKGVVDYNRNDGSPKKYQDSVSKEPPVPYKHSQ